MTPRMIRAVSRTMLALEMALAPPADGEETRALPFVSLGIEEFCRCMEVAIANTTGRRFLDIGAGIATKLLLAEYLGFDAHGIELRKECAEVAIRLVGDDRVRVADAFHVERFDADVVYAHRCCVYDEEQLALERHLATASPPGALLILPHGALAPPLGAEHLGTDVWRLP